ncbi:unnamed protein product [Spirodela intermedia]|uniref:Uncharacterized protein n=1 Tax=Spirodela intermedia TaxID=51605 RepID=A0A7I8K2R6_SPIIN|nr:unnamed protein product [Spirodela intermedia]
MAFRGSFSRSVYAAARSSLRSPAPAPSHRPQVPGASLLGRRRRLNVVAARPAAALGGAFSLLPLHSAVAASRLASHLSFNARACCEISQGIFFFIIIFFFFIFSL